MRVLVQRVQRASVTVEGDVVGQIGSGFLLLVGIGHDDGEPEVTWMADKIAGLRVFPDDEGRMNVSLRDAGGAALVVSQFTLYGDCRKGKRPSFNGAAPGPEAESWVARFTELLAERGISVAGGQFGAMMDVELVNTGPVTLWITRESGEAS